MFSLQYEYYNSVIEFSVFLIDPMSVEHHYWIDPLTATKQRENIINSFSEMC